MQSSFTATTVDLWGTLSHPLFSLQAKTAALVSPGTTTGYKQGYALPSTGRNEASDWLFFNTWTGSTLLHQNKHKRRRMGFAKNTASRIPHQLCNDTFIARKDYNERQEKPKSIFLKLGVVEFVRYTIKNRFLRWRFEVLNFFISLVYIVGRESSPNHVHGCKWCQIQLWQMSVTV